MDSLPLTQDTVKQVNIRISLPDHDLLAALAKAKNSNVSATASEIVLTTLRGSDTKALVPKAENRRLKAFLAYAVPVLCFAAGVIVFGLLARPKDSHDDLQAIKAIASATRDAVDRNELSIRNQSRVTVREEGDQLWIEIQSEHPTVTHTNDSKGIRFWTPAVDRNKLPISLSLPLAH